jgi:hypothetical protein
MGCPSLLASGARTAGSSWRSMGDGGSSSPKVGAERLPHLGSRPLGYRADALGDPLYAATCAVRPRRGRGCVRARSHWADSATPPLMPPKPVGVPSGALSRASDENGFHCRCSVFNGTRGLDCWSPRGRRRSLGAEAQNQRRTRAAHRSVPPASPHAVSARSERMRDEAGSRGLRRALTVDQITSACVTARRALLSVGEGLWMDPERERRSKRSRVPVRRIPETSRARGAGRIRL